VTENRFRKDEMSDSMSMWLMWQADSGREGDG